MFVKITRSFFTHLATRNTTRLNYLMQCSQRREVSYLGQRQYGFQLILRSWLVGLRARYCMWKLRRLLGADFDEKDFLIGARQAATSMIRAVQEANWSRIHNCCTDQGASAVYSLTNSQPNTQYMKLVRFERQHLCQVAPISVMQESVDGRRYVYVDIAFVALRDMRDFATFNEQQEMRQLVTEVLQRSQISEQFAPTHQRIVLGELLLTLRRELTLDSPQDWLVHFYQVFRFKLVNFSPVTLQYRVIEFLKPV